ncbi:MAG: CHAT domain-containing protein [Cyanobacteria bacterium P01_G01_bin.54]
MFKFLLWTGSAVALVLHCTIPSFAQSITAAHDGTGTIVTIDGTTYQIDGGTQAGANLFHSFQAFGLNRGEVANVLSDPAINNIVGRVTGGDPSIINGLIKVSGANSNLYLMNPAGIVFGADARLNINGDFIATTADRIGFAEGWFNANGANNYAELGSAPNQFAFASENPGAIVNLGDLNNAKDISLIGGTVLNPGKVVSSAGNVTIAAVPGERLVRISQPGMLLSLDVPVGAIASTITPVDLPLLLTGAMATDIPPVVQGDVALPGEITGEQIDLYAAGQVQSSNPEGIQGQTRVIRFSATGENPHQGVFIDAQADQPTDLLFGAEAGTIAQMIQTDEDGIAKVSQQLTEIRDSIGELESVAIVAEGNEGNFWLGNQWIHTENIGDYQAQLQTWGDALTERADILLYSCFTALGATGEALINRIAEITGADVAASVDITGSGNYGGDWDLEYGSRSGTIEAGNPFTVETVTDWDGKLAVFTATDAATLIAHITTANGNGQADTINLANNITLTVVDNPTDGANGLPSINATDTLTINGMENTIARGAAAPDFRIFHVAAGAELELNETTISGGSLNGNGGGIYNRGNVILNNSTVSGNTADPGFGRRGGGIHSDATGTLSLFNSTISGNESNLGGGINFENNAGTLTLTNSTISGNQVTGNGGGIRAQGTVNLTNATIAFNTADSDNNGAGNAGGIYIGGGTYSNTFFNSIIANNTDGSPGSEIPDIDANLSTSTVQHNLITRTSGITGTTLSDGINGNIIGQDPLLGSLQNNGGTTQTHALLSGSPAINAGNNSVVSFSLDQAGNLRIFDTIVDIGAYEVQDVTSITVPICDLTCQTFNRFPVEPAVEGKRLAVDPGIEEIELKFIQDYAEALELQFTGDFNAVEDSGAINQLTIAEIQRILKDIEQQTGEQPALIYFTFVPNGTTTPQAHQSSPLIASRLSALLNLDLHQASDQTQSLAGVARADDELQLILVTPDNRPLLRRPPGNITREQVAQQVRRFRRSINAIARPNRYLPPAQQLYDWLIRPLQPKLQDLNISNLGIIADEGLRSLPLAALHNGDDFLIQDYSIGLIPSLSLIDWRYRALDDATVLAMGAAEFTEQSALPAVPTELEVITAQGKGQHYLNGAFTYDTLQDKTEARQFEILHLATHATFQAGSAEAAYIQLWGDENLQLKQLRDLKLYEAPPIELLVLSACETALGDASAELGFAGAALQAGVKSVLASLWQVSDLGTLVLMDGFYDQLTDTEVTIKAEALRQAQLALLGGEVSVQGGFLGETALPPTLRPYLGTDLTHPFYWSGFTLVGSPW